ncbi:hypothetical protein SAMN05421504_106566 [Amycolatopsis xylanica]|uniref:Extracellular repeat, HAF family n=1 Tax=Amycolatopsis xylanica TaxID=589385 RepID=A0A1H3MB89_9PSEU|nr:hypothetical protein [Amycolatopsis xylanica]SDY73853.1 hypothetical protein SAMN05421504_106566 [Amycolatopsis xylanica]
MRIGSMVRTGVVLAAVIAGTAAGTVTAGATTEAGWQPTFLPMPRGHANATGFLAGADGKGGYAGHFSIDGTSKVVTWQNGIPTVRGVPAGYDFATVADQNYAGTVVGDALTDDGHVGGFTLDANGFHELPVPEGYTGVSAVAIANNGLVLGWLYHADPARSATIIYPPTQGEPTILPPTRRGEFPADIDSGGEVLFNSDEGAFVWSSNGIEEIVTPPGHSTPHVNAIQNSQVVGTAAALSEPGSHGFLWRAGPTREPEQLAGSGSATGHSGTNVIIGSRYSAEPYGAPAVWTGGEPASGLLLPRGFTKGLATAVTRDNVVAGIVTKGPLDEGGKPVIWQRPA